LENVYATLMSNYHYISQTKGNIYTVEIKPKSFRPERILTGIKKKIREDKKLLIENPSLYNKLLNSAIMEFDLKQVQRVLKEEEKYFTNYCPADIFSGDKYKILKALKDLRACPQSNLKIHKNGKRRVYISDDLLEVVVDILMQTNILDTIKQVQGVTNKNIEDIYNIYTTKCKPVSEDKAKEIIEDIMPRCLDLKETFNEHEEPWAEVLKYLFSMSARDCSIMMTFCLIDEKAELEKNEIIISIGEQIYITKLGIIDFDVKLMKKIEEYYFDRIKHLADFIDFHSN